MKNLICLILAICLLSTSCTEGTRVNLEGEGDIVTETLTVSSFKKFVLDGPFNVNIEQGTTQKVEATGHANIIDRLKTNVNNNTYTASLKNGSYNNFQLTLNITMVDIESITNDGAGNIYIESITEDDLILKIDGVGNMEVGNDLVIDNSTKLELDGAGNINIHNLETTDLSINLDGVGTIKVAGIGDESIVNFEGAGKIQTFGFEARKVKVNSDGVGKVEVFSLEELTVTIGGVGNVYYKGDPSIQSSISGVGKLVDAN